MIRGMTWYEKPHPNWERVVLPVGERPDGAGWAVWAGPRDGRQVWMRRTATRSRVDPLDSAMHSVWLHGDWHWLTRKMTTDEREAAADAVERCHRLIGDEPGDPALPITGLRWWRS